MRARRASARAWGLCPVRSVVAEVRGYLAGTTGTSILTLYKKGERQMYGITLPDGMRDNEKLPTPIITPTSKEFDGGHDEPLTPDDLEGHLMVAYTASATGKPYPLEFGDAPLVRPHSECLTGDVFGSERCDCGPQLRLALQVAGVTYRVIYGQGDTRVANALNAIKLIAKNTYPTGGNEVFDVENGMRTQRLRAWNCEKCSDPVCEHRLFTSLVDKRQTGLD